MCQHQADCTNKNEGSCLFAKHLVNLANESYEFEKARYEGLERLAGQLLTFVTILSVALVTPAPALFNHVATGSPSQHARLVWEYFILITILLVALGFILASLVRTKNNVLNSPQELKEYISEKQGSYESNSDSEFDIACNYINALQINYEVFLNKSNK